MQNDQAAVEAIFFLLTNFMVFFAGIAFGYMRGYSRYKEIVSKGLEGNDKPSV